MDGSFFSLTIRCKMKAFILKFQTTALCTHTHSFHYFALKVIYNYILAIRTKLR